MLQGAGDVRVWTPMVAPARGKVRSSDTAGVYDVTDREESDYYVHPRTLQRHTTRYNLERKVHHTLSTRNMDCETVDNDVGVVSATMPRIRWNRTKWVVAAWCGAKWTFASSCRVRPIVPILLHGVETSRQSRQMTRHTGSKNFLEQ